MIRSLLEWLLGVRLVAHLPVALLVGAPSPGNKKHLVDASLTWTDWNTVPRVGERVYWGRHCGEYMRGDVVDVVYRYHSHLGPHVEVWVAAL